ncbi:MAG: aminotransferase class V-fold PLP-dependent enzyme [Pseudomonadota bacterium]
MDSAMDDESYWASVRAQFDLPDDFVNLENGYFGAQAIPVFEAYQRQQRQVNRETSYFVRERFAPRRTAILDKLAAFCGVHADELLITRNLTESMNILLQGYPFGAGDAVLAASHDYDTVRDTLDMLAQRKGLTLLRLQLPLEPASDEQIVAMYADAIAPRTRVLLLTHLVHRSGQIMPVAKIAAMARARGVDVMVDAAHSFAQLDYRLPDLGAQFVAVNLHKWLGAPLGLGLLYIERARIADIAPLYGQAGQAPHPIERLANVGLVPPAPLLNIEDAIAFHEAIGGARKEARLRYLTQYWLTRARSIARLRVLTPSAAQRSCAIAAFEIVGVPSQEVARRLMEQYRIFTVTRELGSGLAVRVTTQLFTSLEELDRLVAALGAIASAA